MTKDSSGPNDERKVDAGKSLKNSSKNEKEESVKKALEDMKELFDKKFNEISEQLNKKMNNKDVKINDLNLKVEEFYKKMNDMDITINGLNKKVEGLEKEVKEQWVKFDLMNEINNHTEIYNNINHKILDSKINALIKSFKILFIRKIINTIWEQNI